MWNILYLLYMGAEGPPPVFKGLQEEVRSTDRATVATA